MIDTDQALGHLLIQDGYHHDSMGLAIDPDALYHLTYVRYTEVRTIYHIDINGTKRVGKPIVQTR